MLATSLAAILTLTNASGGQVGYELLIEGRNSAAAQELEANQQLDRDDPVRLINLGIAYAREGREEEARALFQAAMRSPNRAVLETANGEWKDSRHLARLALKMLDSNELRATRMATR